VAKSTALAGARKPKKPRPDFPLFVHQSDRWAKKVRGKLHYFGKASTDPEGEAAIAIWLDQKDALLAGRVPKKRNGDEVTVRQLVNKFLSVKLSKMKAGEIKPRTFKEYHSSCERVVTKFGEGRVVNDLDSADFLDLRSELAETRGPVALLNEIVRIRMIFKFGHDERITHEPVYGQSFSTPSRKVLSKAAATSESKMFEREELLKILDDTASRPVLHAIILLAANCGYGQTDIAQVPKKAIDLKGGWATFPRPKTGVHRRAKLWPETIAALKAADAVRLPAKAAADADLFFLTPKGQAWIRDLSEDVQIKDGDRIRDEHIWTGRSDSLGTLFGKVLKKLGIDGRRGFYGIRHTFQTIAENSRDLPAVMKVMGHLDDSMSSRYRDRIDDGRLEAVASVVHEWLFETK
jgi:integrase